MQITSSVNNEGLHNAIKQMIPQIVEIMNTEVHYNLRTYQFTLSFIEKLLSIVMGNRLIIEHENALITKLVIAILRVAIAFKKGEENYKWKNNEEFGQINTDGKYGSIMSFRFIHDYVYHSAYDESRIIRVLESYAKQLDFEKSYADNAYINLQSYWMMEDKEVEEQLNRLDTEMFNKLNEYPVENYINVLSMLYGIKDLDFEVDIDSYIKRMIYRIEKERSSPQSNVVSTLDERSKFYYEFQDATTKLLRAYNQSIEENDTDRITQIMNKGKGWGVEFKDYCARNVRKIRSSGKFLAKVNMASVAEALKNGSTQDLCNFRYGVYRIYDDAIITIDYLKDRAHIQLLHNDLSKMHFDSKTKEFNRKVLIEALEQYLAKFEQISAQ